jgi:serine/threonine protein kinase
MMPVISDFGLSKKFKSVSTREYFSPEQPAGQVSRKADVFSLGLIFVELGLLLFGKKKFEASY